jgi:hypothetical protein
LFSSKDMKKMTQVVACLLSKHEALSSNSSTAKERRKGGREREGTEEGRKDGNREGGKRRAGRR